MIVQAISPPPGYPPGVTAQQLAACRDASIQTDLYIYLWPGDTPSTIQSRLALADGFTIRRLWLDVEESGVTEAQVAWALAQLDSFPSKLDQAGVYTGGWFWPQVGSTIAFSDRPLWDSNFDGIPDASRGFRPYGGWTSPAVKQYMGTSSLSGVGGIDRDVLSDAEAELLRS